MIKKKYICDTDNTHSPLTKGKIYIIWQTEKDKPNCMYTIDHYDNELKPGPLNDFWFFNHFKEVGNVDMSSNIKTL
jgi:hypothetical protein